ncbi:FecR domain-containing protein [Acetobacter orientalis]|uniref:FecR family protein n=1 Tax=Acetobacter orientalis TaxID=146474 RepID=UPI00209FB6E7|nr:FecR domain-containing protein [Acetobacter orientalis]MCP1216831.1 FecR domain-containing protein [Acetobacter orientalis]MCP1219558.1 FecR domain-containing protein [Acetobacter orientalis]
MSGTETYDRISLEAARWLVSLEENPDDPQLKGDFAVWLAANPAHQEAWDATSGIYDMMGPLFEAERRQVVPVGLGVSRTRRCLKRTLWMLPVGMAAAIALFVLAPDWYYRVTADYATSETQRTALKLADGSEVSLAPHSAIDVVYKPSGVREVHLLRGEGFFRVVHDASHPFKVVSGTTKVTDIGTEFDMRLLATGSYVAVKTGRVHVDGPNNFSVDLGAGQSVNHENQKGLSCGKEEADNIGAWATSGQLVLQDASFAEAIERIGSYYSGKIILADRTLNTGKVTGVYNLSTPEAALKAMADTQGASLRHITPWIIVIFRR